jgi:hypothetical protein
MKHIIIITLLFLSASTRGEDRGIGLIYFSAHGPASSSLQSDSMSIYSSPSETGDVVATFSLLADTTGYQYKLYDHRPISLENIVEYEYEVSGIPMDTVDAVSGWVRVIYGFSDQRTSCKGWIRINIPRYDTLMWSTELQKHPLFFSPEPRVPEFYDRPGGNKVSFRLERLFQSDSERFDYTLYPIEVHQSWMKVHVVTPSDFCDTPAAPRSGDVWIKYLDAKGRPLVFYYTRGC